MRAQQQRDCKIQLLCDISAKLKSATRKFKALGQKEEREQGRQTQTSKHSKQDKVVADQLR